MKCSDCVFMEICQDMSARYEICRFCDRLPEAVEAAEACRYSGKCKNHLTVAEAKKFVEKRNNQGTTSAAWTLMNSSDTKYMAYPDGRIEAIPSKTDVAREIFEEIEEGVKAAVSALQFENNPIHRQVKHETYSSLMRFIKTVEEKHTEERK